ncbi:murein biosynthesis integral membrane protein MurJ [Nocardioides alkalitolerans]|uniref:murein biosynthesis integral membrane protein MurJ n=1 Tax=Nocardioides alkalitolerans TaxID=281714 RepID=UPI000419F00A|nr:murein biosynthesis integral membrane protein MurJ [Nocardioides alkalitolerans]
MTTGRHQGPPPSEHDGQVDGQADQQPDQQPDQQAGEPLPPTYDPFEHFDVAVVEPPEPEVPKHRAPTVAAAYEPPEPTTPVHRAEPLVPPVPDAAPEALVDPTATVERPAIRLPQQPLGPAGDRDGGTTATPVRVAGTHAGPVHAADEVSATGASEVTEPVAATDRKAPAGTDASVLSSSAVMAAGTIVSRLSGYVRGILLAAALGTKLHADIFAIANTIPNMVYILLAGGVFNAVLVPQLVRALKQDPDGGAAYVNRIVTLAALFLGTVTVLLVVAAPWVMSIYLEGRFNEPELAAQRDSAVAFARFCLPQVFFYGMFVLVGQILNSRGRFGPMMWAPIANNVISVIVLVIYLVVFGPVAPDAVNSAFSTNQELVLGIGSTLGIVAQFVILVPYLRSAGVSIRPRFDFIGTGLGHTLKLGAWTIGFVIVNQAAYTVVVRLASGGNAGSDDGTGYFVYSNALLIMMVPHAIVTVSLTTAILPRLSAAAAERDLTGMGATLASTLRTTLAFVVPVAAVVPVVAPDLANLIWGYGAASASYDDFVPSLTLFAPVIVLFTVHYMMLRGFYALEQTRRVFWIQCIIAAVNVTLALLFVSQASAAGTAPALVLAYGGAYLVGASVSYGVLARTLGGLQTRTTALFAVRILLAVLLGAGAAWLTRWALHPLLPDDPHPLAAGLLLAAVGLVHVLVVLAAAWLLRIEEVRSVVATVLRRRRRPATG